MKVLILSCKTGQGHNAVANAIAETLDRRGHDCEVLDALSFVSDRTARVMSWGHSFIYCYCPEVFQAGYEAAERFPSTLSEKSVAYRFFARGSQSLYEYCQAGKFDAIVCTHVFASMMLTDVKRNYSFDCKSYFVATDYTGYPGVRDTQMDVYFIPDERLADDYDGKTVITSGIPVFQKFFVPLDKPKAKQLIGLPAEKKHILMMSGSMGCGPIEEITQKIVEKMSKDSALSIICGTNQRLYQRLMDRYGNNESVKIYGFVQNIDQMMAATDVYVTKPGGISTTEAMVRGLPMVLVDAVAGCEDYNMRYFRNMGGAVAGMEPEKIAQLCMELVENENRRERMTVQLEKNCKNGAQIICDYLQENT